MSKVADYWPCCTFVQVVGTIWSHKIFRHFYFLCSSSSFCEDQKRNTVHYRLGGCCFFENFAWAIDHFLLQPWFLSIFFVQKWCWKLCLKTAFKVYLGVKINEPPLAAEALFFLKHYILSTTKGQRHPSIQDGNFFNAKIFWHVGPKIDKAEASLVCIPFHLLLMFDLHFPIT